MYFSNSTKCYNIPCTLLIIQYHEHEKENHSMPRVIKMLLLLEVSPEIKLIRLAQQKTVSFHYFSKKFKINILQCHKE